MGACAYGVGNYADTVVYGTIRTAEEEKPVAEVIAIKDGKCVYVGDEAGVAAYIQDGITKVIDHRGKGMVMPGGELVIDVDAEGNVDCLKATGSLDLAGVSLRVRNAEALDRDATYVIATANAIVGGFASVDLPKRWTASVVGGRVVLSRNNGMAILVR